MSAVTVRGCSPKRCEAVEVLEQSLPSSSEVEDARGHAFATLYLAIVRWQSEEPDVVASSPAKRWRRLDQLKDPNGLPLGLWVLLLGELEFGDAARRCGSAEADLAAPGVLPLE